MGDARPGAEATPALLASLVREASDAIATVTPELTISYANAAAGVLLGRPVEELAGASVADLVHPEDLERALLLLTGWREWGAPRGTAGFRLRHRSGEWIAVDMSSATVSNGDESLFAVYCRPADTRHATEEVMLALLAGQPSSVALTPVLGMFDWEINDLAVAIAWYEQGHGHQFVSTGLPRELTGAEDDPGAPWLAARRTLEESFLPEPSDLDPLRRRLAHEAGRGTLWVVPIADETTGVAALVTAWGRVDGPTPRGHAYGMAAACSYVELILRWSSQVRQLEAAAHQDPLTGVANRTTLRASLDSAGGAGAVLFCDLDRFKEINDRYGHAAGDVVLRAVASRIQHTVRSTDLVARVGGDEFVVVAHGADPAMADDLAERIRREVERPIELDAEPVAVGITVGVAHDEAGIDDTTMAAADRALLEAKRAARSR